MHKGLNFENVDKPWGSYERFTLNYPSTVKILTLKPGQRFSLQKHENRDEFWKLVKGDAILTIGDKTIDASEGEEFLVMRGENHRVEAKDTEVRVLEISFGDFDETDIERVEDDYGRS